MSKGRCSLTLDPELLEEIDRVRKHEPRASFINRKMRGLLFPRKED